MEEGLHDVKAVLQAERDHAHSRCDGISAAHPVPEPKSILRVDAKSLDQLEVGTDGYHVLGCGLRAQFSSQPRPAKQQHLLELSWGKYCDLLTPKTLAGM